MVDKTRKIPTLGMGAEEDIARRITIPPNWATTPAAPLGNKLFDKDGVDVTATNLTGTPSIAGSVFTTGLLTGLSAGEVYTLKIWFSESGNKLYGEGYIVVDP